MATLEKLMLKKIIVKMKSFSMNEIQQLINIIQLNLKWNGIIDLVTECRLQLTVSNIVMIVEELLKENGSIEETYYRVLLADAIYHQNGLWWTVTIDKVKKCMLDKGIIRNNIQAMLDKYGIKAITCVMKCNQLFWVMIIMSETKRDTSRLSLQKPHFFTISPGEVFHVFHKPQNVNHKLLKIVINSVGANNYKPYVLSGKNVLSMVDLLEDKNKENQHENMKVLPAHVKVEEIREYAKNWFGDKRLVLNDLTININCELSSFSSSVAASKKFQTKILLKNDNIVDGIKNMMSSNTLQPPYPEWVTKLPMLGTNCININSTYNQF